MKRLLCATAVVAILVPDIVAAQSSQQQRPGPHRPATQPARPPQGRPPATTLPAPAPTARPPHAGPNRPPQHRPPAARPPVARPPVQHRPGYRPPNFRPIHAPHYRYPRGYRYRRWTIGLLLPSIFLSNAYYYNSWGSFGLGPPPPGHRWVRYGPDLLLINVRTRRVVDVIYGAFY